MKNIPRIFINEKLEVGKEFPLGREQLHYLQKVMRTDKCLIFNDRLEFEASIDNSRLIINNLTGHADPSNNLTFAFAPIKRTDEMLNMATQMGVGFLQPVITERTVAHHVNWARIEKIITEAAEQSGRNSVPKLLPPIKFADLDKSNLIFADERFAYKSNNSSAFCHMPSALLIGPEGGFSDAEFASLDASGAVGISLGKTILRAETAAVAALALIGHKAHGKN